MSNETDLDWLVRVTAGVIEPWCEFIARSGIDSWACTRVFDLERDWFTRAQYLARRSELQNKPTEWPKHANWLAQHEDGEWTFYSDSADNSPQNRQDGNWYSDDVAVKCCHSGEVLGDWRDTLERRPDNPPKPGATWHERGELPPVGTRCEALITSERQWVEIEVVCHRDGFALGWCPKERCGYHGNEPTDFRPIRTEREVLMGAIVSQGFLSKDGGVCGQIADAILAAGFSLRAK